MIVDISVACGAASDGEPIDEHGVQVERRHADDERRGEHADHQADLLIDRRRADEVAGLQVLRRRAGDRRGDADDARRPRAPPARRRRPSSRAATKIVQVRISVAIVMPEIGFDELPMRPVIRDDTVTKKKPKTTMRMAARKLYWSGMPGASARKSASSSEPTSTTDQRQVAVGPRAPAAAPLPGAELLHAFAERRHDRRHRARERDEAGGEHRTGARIPDVGAPQLPGAHLIDPQAARRHRRERDRHVVAHDAQQRQQHEPREHAAGEHHARDARTDDVSDPHVLGGDVDVQRARSGECRCAAIEWPTSVRKS